MCGIAGLFVKDPAYIRNHGALEHFVDHLFLGIENRGKMATGFVAVTADGHVAFDKADETASDFIRTREDLPVGTQIVLCHTRFTTKGTEKNNENNHPVIYENCFTIHNGSVNNDDALFEKYEMERRAEVDTEVIAALMNKSDFDIESMKEYLSEMSGPVACATVNPKQHPGKLILAKTNGSPLHWIEQPKFFLFASTVDTMRDAWGRILGTPPNKKKFKEAWANNLLVLTAEGVEEHKIPFVSTKPGQAKTTTTTSATSTTSGSDGACSTIADRAHVGLLRQQSGSVSPEGRIHKDAIKARTEWKRANGMGSALVFKHDGNLLHLRKSWARCMYCEIMTDTIDQKVTTRGKMCVDCYDSWMDLLKYQEEVKQQFGDDDADDEGSVELDFTDVKKVFTTEELKRMDEWVPAEVWAHTQTMKNLSDELGCEPETLEFMMWRMTDRMIEAIANPGYAGWVTDMQELYDWEYEMQWELLTEGDSTAPELDDCIKHLSRRDQKQIAARAELVRRVQERMDNKRRFPKAIKAHGANCMFCKRRRKYVISRGETEELAYCTRHFKDCAIRGCKKECNHTREDGIRVCHEHSRGQTGCCADTVARKEGYQVPVLNSKT